MNAKVTYHALISDEHRHHDQQSMDQVFLAIGANLVTGFGVYRYAFEDPHGNPVTVVSIHGSGGYIFGAYEFAGTV
jgi:hypothetical protein